MDIWQLKCFIEVCNDRSLSKASRNLHISQQGLSKLIKNLEDELENPLFYRSPKGVDPTEFGYLLLDKSKKIIEDYDSMLVYLNSISRKKNGSITIGLPHILYTKYFAAIICGFSEKYPEIKLNFVGLGSNESEKYMQDEMLDLAFAVKPVNTDKFVYIPVSASDMMLIVSSKSYLAKKGSVSVKDIKNERLIMLSQEYKTRQLTIDIFIKSGFKPNIVFTTSQQELIIELVALEKGVAILPESSLTMSVRSNDKISIVAFNDMPFEIEMGFIMNKYKQIDYLTSAFINFTLDFFKKYKHE